MGVKTFSDTKGRVEKVAIKMGGGEGVKQIFLLLRVSCFSRRNNQATATNNFCNLRFTNLKMGNNDLHSDVTRCYWVMGG